MLSESYLLEALSFSKSVDMCVYNRLAHRQTSTVNDDVDKGRFSLPSCTENQRQIPRRRSGNSHEGGETCLIYCSKSICGSRVLCQWPLFNGANVHLEFGTSENKTTVSESMLFGVIGSDPISNRERQEESPAVFRDLNELAPRIIDRT